jgi:hypothetical protein
MSIELSPTARLLTRSTFFGKDFDTHRQEIIDAINATFGADVASNIVASEQGVMLIEANANALSTLSWYGDRQGDDVTLQYARLRFAAVTIARQLGYKTTSSVPAVVDVRVQLVTAPPVQLTIPKGQKASGPDGLGFETLADLVFDPGQVGAGLPLGMNVVELVIDPATPATIYAATTSGVLKTLSSGTLWSSANSGLSNTNITALVIDPLSPTTLYAGTLTSGVFKTTDGGLTWGPSSTGLSNIKITALAVDPVTPSTLYAGTNAGGLYKSINSGTTWSSVNVGIIDFVIQSIAIDPVTPATIYAGMFSGGVFKTINSALSWSASNTGLADTNVTDIAIDPVTPATIYLATVGGGIYKTTTSGALWAQTNAGFTATSPVDIKIDPVTPSIIYAASSDSGVFKTVDSGANWATAVSGLTATNNQALAIDPLTPVTVYAGSTDGGIFVSINSAVTWDPINNGIDDPIKIVQMREGRTLQAVFRSTGEPFQIYELSVPGTSTIAQGSPVTSVAGILWPETALLAYEQTDQVEIEYGLSPPRVIFGDGIAGNIPPKDAEIIVTFFVTSGVFGSIASDTIGNFTTPIVAGTTTISTVLSNTSPSTPGSDPEPLNSIKVNAPQVFQAAGRAVTADDLTGWINSYVDPVFGAVSKGRATSPRSAIADAEAQSIIASLIALNVPTSLTTRLSDYVEAILSSNCSANVVNAQILAADSIGRYVPASEGLARNLATFLNGIAESTVEAVVTDGSVNLLSVDAIIGVKTLSNITSDEIRIGIVDNVRTAVQSLLIGREFGDSLRAGDLYQTVEAITGVDYSHITVVVRNNIGDDISSTRLNSFGDLEISEFEVITMGASPDISLL